MISKVRLHQANRIINIMKTDNLEQKNKLIYQNYVHEQSITPKSSASILCGKGHWRKRINIFGRCITVQIKLKEYVEQEKDWMMSGY